MPITNSVFEMIEKYKPIEEELQRAKKLHPCWPKNMYHQLAILSEECGEVAKAINDSKWDETGDLFGDVKMELIQTAAMCMRMLENLPKEV